MFRSFLPPGLCPGIIRFLLPSRRFPANHPRKRSPVSIITHRGPRQTPSDHAKPKAAWQAWKQSFTRFRMAPVTPLGENHPTSHVFERKLDACRGVRRMVTLDDFGKYLIIGQFTAGETTRRKKVMTNGGVEVTIQTLWPTSNWRGEYVRFQGLYGISCCGAALFHGTG